MGESVPRLVVETVLLALAVVGLCLLAVLIAGVPVYAREYFMRRAGYQPPYVRAIRSVHTERALAALKQPESLGGGLLLPWIYSVVADDKGIRIIRGASTLHVVFQVGWEDIKAIEVEDLEDNDAFVAFLVLHLKSDNFDAAKLPMAIVPTGLVRIRVVGQSEVRKVIDRILPNDHVGLS